MESSAFPAPRLTPWVIRILALMAGVQLVLETILTSPSVTAALAFDPHGWFARPWTVVTYAFVHGGLFHLLFNGLALFAFGPTVERRLGGPAFLLYYVYSLLGAALFAAALDRVYAVPPFIGASGAVLGVILAYSVIHPDREIITFPIPIPIRARTFVFIIAFYDLCGILFLRSVFQDGIAHEAHLGGLFFGWVFFRMQGMRGQFDTPGAPPPRPVERRVLAGRIDVGDTSPLPRPQAPARPPAIDQTQAELDRVLDKISATGMQSLTAAERKFLDEVAKKKADGAH
jgi:membrane associated rhomboid family serine protease